MLEGVVSDRYEPDTVKVAARFAGAGDELRLASIDAPQEAAEPLLDEMVWLGMVYLQDPALAEDPATRARVQANIDGVEALQFVDGAFAALRTERRFVAFRGRFREKRQQLCRHSQARTPAQCLGAGLPVAGARRRLCRIGGSHT